MSFNWPTPQAPSPQAPTPQGANCCPAGGSGAAVLFGVSIIDLNDGSGSNIYKTVLASDGISTLSFLFFSKNYEGSYSVDDSLAGFFITQASAWMPQSIHTWYGNSNHAPFCQKQSVGLPNKVIPGFNLCPGRADSWFVGPSTTFALGGVASSVYSYGGPTLAAGSTALYHTATCEMETLLSNNPINNELFSLTIYGSMLPTPAHVMGLAAVSMPSGCL